MRHFCRALVAVPVALIIYAMTAWGQQSPETVTITKEFEFNDASKVTGSDWQTPVATYNDSIYYVYVNRQLKTLRALVGAKSNRLQLGMLLHFRLAIFLHWMVSFRQIAMKYRTTARLL
mgnify:CR=1 FL=1